jgi:hypothetical protein
MLMSAGNSRIEEFFHFYAIAWNGEYWLSPPLNALAPPISYKVYAVLIFLQGKQLTRKRSITRGGHVVPYLYFEWSMLHIIQSPGSNLLRSVTIFSRFQVKRVHAYADCLAPAQHG